MEPSRSTAVSDLTTRQLTTKPEHIKSVESFNIVS